MDNLAVSAIEKKPAPVMSVTGYIFIKRKMFWAERYARVKDRKLTYYETKADSTPRAILHLADAILVQNINGREDLMELKLRSGSILSLFIKIENKSFRSKFINCVLENIKEPTASALDEECTSEIEEDDLLADSPLPDLPPMYQYVFEEKYVTEKAEVDYVRSELLHKRHKDPLNTPTVLFKMLAQGFLVLVGYLLGIYPLYVGVILAVLILLVLFRLRHKKQTRIKQAVLLKQNIVDIGYALKHKRQDLYNNPHAQIQYKQAHYKGDARVFIVETEKQHLKYLWDITGFGQEAIVTVYYDSNAPDIEIRKLPYVVAGARIEEALKGLAGPKLKKIQSMDTFKSDRILGRMDTLRKDGSAISADQRTSLDRSIDKDGDRSLDKGAPTQFLPPLQELIKLNPEVPKELFNDLIISRGRYLQHLNSKKWDNVETKNGCTMSFKDNNGNLTTKGQTTVKGNLEQIMQYILDIEKRPEYDSMYNTGTIIKDYGIVGIVYQRFNGIFPVKGRDFVIILCKEKIEGGYMLHGKTIPYEYPGDGKCVRAIAVSAGFEVKEVEPGMIKVTYLTESDLCGDLPNIVKRTAGKLQSGVISKFREVVLKKFK